jgi:2-polyprenyl-6-methoxyphenol hydroxylase-like FAD-dependent oxidoreductase
MLEKLVLKRHSLAHEDWTQKSAGPLILIGDAFHNVEPRCGRLSFCSPGSP